MGNYISNYFGGVDSVIPNIIKVEDLLNDESKAQIKAKDELIETLMKRGFAILKPTDDGLKRILKARDDVSDFFDLDDEEKLKYKIPSTFDPIMGEIRKNRGYIPQPHKEYLKIRVKDEEDQYPENCYESFKDGMTHLHEICTKSLELVSEGLSTSDERLCEKELLEDINPFIKLGSSLSVIRYYEQEITKENKKKNGRNELVNSKDETVGNENLEGQDESNNNNNDNDNDNNDNNNNNNNNNNFVDDEDSEDENIVCGEHYDTGIFTCILISEVPGLEAINRLSEEKDEWLEVEKIDEIKHHLILIMGRKIEMLSKKDCGLKATFHRVVTDPTVRRHSILFFMDLPHKTDD